MENDGKILKIPLWRETYAEESLTPGYEKGMRPLHTVLKVFWTLTELYKRVDAQYHELFTQQMTGDEAGDYNPKRWEIINDLEDKRARISGAIAALRWVLNLTDSLGLDIKQTIRVNLTHPIYTRDEMGNKIQMEAAHDD